MLATIGSAIGLFAATNIDDIVVLTVLFLASSRGKPRPWQIVAGQYLGFITLVVISVIAALGLTIVPDEWVGFLGLIPLGIGIWTLVRGLRRNGDDDDDDAKITAADIEALRAALAPHSVSWPDTTLTADQDGAGPAPAAEDKPA